MIRLVALTGPAGVGKSTLANAIQGSLVVAEGSYDVRRWSFADPLRAATEAIFGSAYRSQAQKSATDDFWATHLGPDYSTGRRILQRFGTDVCRAHISSMIWLYALERRLRALDRSRLRPRGTTRVVILDDARFPNEADFIRARGGLICHLRRTGIAHAGDHASEQPLPHAPGDWTLDLDGPELISAAARRIANHLITPQE